jgi:choline kinase
MKDLNITYDVFLSFKDIGKVIGKKIKNFLKEGEYIGFKDVNEEEFEIIVPSRNIKAYLKFYHVNNEGDYSRRKVDIGVKTIDTGFDLIMNQKRKGVVNTMTCEEAFPKDGKVRMVTKEFMNFINKFFNDEN